MTADDLGPGAPGLTRSRRRARAVHGPKDIGATDSTLRPGGSRVGDLLDGVGSDRELGPLLVRRSGLSVQRLERRPQQRADLAHVLLEPLLLGCGLARDPTPLGVRFLHDQVRLAPRLLLHVLRSAFGGDECRAQERLQLAMLRGLGLELLELIGEVGTLAPHLLEAVGDLGEEPVDALAAIPAEERAAELQCRISTGVSGM